MTARRIVVHRDPVDGACQSVIGWDADQPVSPMAAPHASLRLSSLLA